MDEDDKDEMPEDEEQNVITDSTERHPEDFDIDPLLSESGQDNEKNDTLSEAQPKSIVDDNDHEIVNVENDLAVTHDELHPPNEESFLQSTAEPPVDHDDPKVSSVPQIIEPQIQQENITTSSADNPLREESNLTQDYEQSTPSVAYINTSGSSANISQQPSFSNPRDSISSTHSLNSNISQSHVHQPEVAEDDEDDDDSEEEMEEEEERFQTSDEIWATNAMQRQEEFESQRNQVMSMSTAIMDLRLKWRKLREEFILERAFIDDTDSILIESRISEIKSMCRFIIRPKNVLLGYTPETQDLIIKYSEMDQEEFKRERRKNWKTPDLFFYVFRMVRLMCGTFLYRRKYKYIDEKISDAQLIQNHPRNTQNLMLYKCSVGQNMRRYMTKNPKYRTKAELKKIIFFLQQTEAFTHLFPAEMETDCAMAVSYEQYDDGRLVAVQDRSPDRFYYILEGKLNIVRHFKLTLGEVNRSIGAFTRGMTTDPSEMVSQTPRNYMLIAKGLVEVLVLHKSDYFKLIKFGAGPPIDFLSKIESFNEFPMEEFVKNSDAVNVVYYERDKVIFQDSAYTPWIYLVKSGSVKVVRKQTVYDTKNELSRIRDMNRLEGKPNTGHAKAMLGLNVKQRQFKKNNPASLELPPIETGKRTSLVSKQSTRSTKFRAPWRNKNLLSDMLKPFPAKEEPPAEGDDLPVIVETLEVQQDEQDDKKEDSQECDSENSDDLETMEDDDNNLTEINPDEEIMRNFMSDINADINTVLENNILDSKPTPVKTEEQVASHEEEIKKKVISRLRSPLIRIPHRRTSVHPWAAYITTGQRSQRGSVQAIGLFGDLHEKKKFERPTLVQIDTLYPGDAFGFYRIASWGQDIRPKSASRTGLSLVSEGAEVIRVNKRFFVNTAKNNTMLLVDLLNKQYVTQSEVKDILKNRKTWNEYKSELMRRMAQIHCH